ncbi:DNA repair protein RecO [Rothia sp. LK2588]|uniref:DNA repair protein RecO n=1 Tax=Rothia sp. LK2588 TaxID=3114369 RepID=UPI0034D01407
MVAGTGQGSYTDRALVLRTQPLAETDRIVILLTAEHGVVHAVAKGVRKTTSKFGGRLEPFMLVNVSLAPGKNLHTVAQVTTHRAYASSIVADFDRYSAALLLCESAETFTANVDTDEAGRYFVLLAGALSALARNTHPIIDIVVAFLGRSLIIAGWGFSTHQCHRCSRPLNHGGLQLDAGMLCDECMKATGEPVSYTLGSDVFDYLSATIFGDWEKIDDLILSGTRERAFTVLTAFVQHTTEKPLKSLDLMRKG